MSTQLVLFDYDSLDTETRIITRQRATEIKTLMRATAENIMQVGEKLLDVQVKLGNTTFDAWLQAEFDWSRRTAYNFIGVYKEFRGRANFAQMDIATSALYLLASPSTPGEVREEMIDRAEAGERISHTEVKAAVVEAKAKRQPALPPAPAPVERAPWDTQTILPPGLVVTKVVKADTTPPPPTAMERLRQQAKSITGAAPVIKPDDDDASAPDADSVDEDEPEVEAAEIEQTAPPAPHLPLPSPVMGVAPLVISLTVRAERALLTARRGDETVASEPLSLDAVGRRVQAIIDRQFNRLDGDGSGETLPLWLQD
jgi:hypothetical protein